MAAMVGSASSLGTIDGRSLLFLILSGLATGASWLCYFAALARGDVSRVAPIDKLSTVLAIVLALILLSEPVTAWSVVGIVVGCRSPCAGAEVGSRTRSRPRCSPR